MFSYVYIYVYICIYICICTYVYTYIYFLQKFLLVEKESTVTAGTPYIKLVGSVMVYFPLCTSLHLYFFLPKHTMVK